MSRRLAQLTAALRYAAPADRPAIRALILALILEIECGFEGGADMASATKVRHGETENAEARPSRIGVDTERADAPPCSPCLRSENDSIGTAAQEPLPTPLLATEAADRGADVDGRPVEATSEKVQAGVRLTSPEPSSEGGHIPGPAGSLAPAVSLLKETAAPRRCGGCRAELVRRQDERPSIFAKREFCSRSCAIGQRWAKGKIASIDQVAQAKTAPRVKRTASAPPPAPPETPQILAEPGDWRIYFAMGPTKRARSLSEARSRAIASGADYVEIANLDTGQHLMRFRGCWTETRPAGSAPGGWA